MGLSDITHSFADLPHFLRIPFRSSVDHNYNLLEQLLMVSFRFLFLEDIGKPVAPYLNQTESIARFAGNHCQGLRRENGCWHLSLQGHPIREQQGGTEGLSSFPSLNEVAAALNAQPGLKVEIHGHTDGSGARAYNQDLSQRRAESVKAYLESNGIDASRMTAIGFGPDRPIDSNATKEGRTRNRRVEFKPVR